MIQLRDYQEKIINEIKQNLLMYKRICIQAPCGSGKSVILSKIIADATKKRNRILFLVHRKELIEQINNTLQKFNVDFMYVKLLMVQTAVRRLKKMQQPTIIITDENHHCLAKSYTKIYDYFPNSFLLGFTATPVRLNGEGLGEIYKYMVKGPEIKWLIKNKFLAPYKLFSVKLADTSKLHIKAGDFNKKETTSLMENNTIYGETIKNYLKLANGKQTIVYCSSIESSIETSKMFNDKNIRAKHLDGSTPKNERQKTIEKFRTGEIKILCNVDLFGEGFDVPDCECVILLRPTKSLSLYIQQSMRSMRYKEGKEAIIIDHVGNCFEHGLPDDLREWTLKGKQKKEKNEIKVKECPKCFSVIQPGLKNCPYCGLEFPKMITRPEKEIVDVELAEIKRKDILRMKPFSYIKKLNTLNEILDFVELKNYKPGVIYHQLEERENIRVTENDLKRWQKIAGYKRGWWTHRKNLINESEVI